MIMTVALALAASAASPAPSAKAPARLLVVTVTKGFRHESIPVLEKVIGELGKESGAFTVDYARTDEDLAAKMTVAALAQVDGVVFASTTGDLPLPDREAFVSWIEAGHGFAGVHAASDTFPGFPGYLDMIGGQFEHHGPQTTVEVHVEDLDHPSTRGMEKTLSVFDEIYQFKRFDPARVHLLFSLDKHPETGAPGTFPLAWTRTPGKGRVFYTALGHRDDVVEAPWFRRHLLGGLLWTIGRDRR